MKAKLKTGASKLSKMTRSRLPEIVLLIVLAAVLMAIFNILIYSNIELSGNMSESSEDIYTTRADHFQNLDNKKNKNLKGRKLKNVKIVNWTKVGKNKSAENHSIINRIREKVENSVIYSKLKENVISVNSIQYKADIVNYDKSVTVIKNVTTDLNNLDNLTDHKSDHSLNKEINKLKTAQVHWHDSLRSRDDTTTPISRRGIDGRPSQISAPRIGVTSGAIMHTDLRSAQTDMTSNLASGETNQNLRNANQNVKHLINYGLGASAMPIGNQDISNSNSEESVVNMERIHGDVDNPGEVPDIIKWDRILTMATTGYHSFNATMSDMAGNNRSMFDTRHVMCKNISYHFPPNISTTIIVVFHNEARSSLLRTIHSLLDKTPVKLLRDILLIDDASTYGWLKQPLYDYISHISNRVKLLRLPRRQGLIRARLLGAQKAKGDVLVFLDAHVEVNHGWLPPLLNEIIHSPKTIAVPVMDIINWQTFRFTRALDNYQGSFLWNLDFKYKLLPHDFVSSIKDKTQSYPSPVMVGCAHALWRDYFFSLGAYDDGMEIWGGENIEHSFRTWMCGGQVMIVPCSRVAHIFKPKLPYTFKNTAVDVIQRNMMRLVEVWMDDYGKYYYALQPNLPPIDLKSIKKRKQLRHDLQCKSFQWYLDTVVPEMPIPPITATHFGQLKSAKFISKCVEFDSSNILMLMICEQQKVSDQYFYLDMFRRLKFRDLCLTIYSGRLRFADKSQIVPQDSHHNDAWTWIFKSNQIIHIATKLCLTVSQWNTVIATPCIDKNNKTADRLIQMWEFTYDFDFTKKWNLEEMLLNSIKRPVRAVHFGALVNGAADKCVRIFDGTMYHVASCTEVAIYDKVIYLDTENYIRYKSLAVGFDVNTSSVAILPYREIARGVENTGVESEWSHDVTGGELRIMHVDLCLALVREHLEFHSCSNMDSNQKWRFVAPEYRTLPNKSL